MPNCLRENIQQLNTQLSRILQSALVGSAYLMEHQKTSGSRISDCVQCLVDGTRVGIGRFDRKDGQGRTRGMSRGREKGKSGKGSLKPRIQQEQDRTTGTGAWRRAAMPGKELLT
jgi:hypothetical protein